MVSRPALRSGPSDGGVIVPAYSERASERDAIGVTVFMISWVSTLMSLVQDSDSFSSMASEMSFTATIFTSLRPMCAAVAEREMFVWELSEYLDAFWSRPSSTFSKAPLKEGLIMSSWRSVLKDDTPSRSRACLLV